MPAPYGWRAWEAGVVEHASPSADAAADGPPERWVDLDDEHGTAWRIDLGFLESRWRCTWGDGCLGIGDEPAPERQEGCCSVGAQLLDEEEARAISALATTLGPERFEHHAEAEAGGVIASGSPPATRVVDGACVLLNRPGFAGGAGCALHLGALDDGEDPMDWKPSVCWQLPLKVERPAPGAPTPVVLRRWRRADWGSGGASMAWCCTEGGLAYDAEVPVLESLAEELEALAGPTVVAQLRRIADGSLSPPTRTLGGTIERRTDVDE